MTDLLAGVDVGTSSLKVGVFETTGALLCSSRCECPPSYGADGRVEIEAERWWQAFDKAFGDCVKKTDAKRIRAIGVSSQAQSYVLVDADGRALGPAVSWLDKRGDAAGTAQCLSAHDYFAHTGWAEPNEMLAACKLRTLAPRRWAPGARLLFADSYIIHRLTGAHATSRNLAAMSGLYSMRTGGWWPEAVECARVPPDALPDICEMGQTAGTLRTEIARRWGMDAIHVVAGANDQTAAALGVGLCAPGRTALGLGTALVAYQVISADAPAHPARPLRGPYAGGLAYHILLSSTAGAAVAWAQQTLAPGTGPDEFYAEALSAPPGCDGVRALIDFGDSPGSAGGLFGLTLAHKRSHVFRAVLEAVACIAREKLNMLDARGTVKVTGGGSTNDAWMQVLADVTERALERSEQADAGLWGTALLAGAGRGIFSDILSAAGAARHPCRKFSPSGEHAAAYRQMFEDYLRMKRP
jgi:sugar (pentulose or hexulose) kinase